MFRRRAVACDSPDGILLDDVHGVFAKTLALVVIGCFGRFDRTATLFTGGQGIWNLDQPAANGRGLHAQKQIGVFFEIRSRWRDVDPGFRCGNRNWWFDCKSPVVGRTNRVFASTV